MPSEVFVSATPEIRAFLETCQVDGAGRKWAGSETIELDELYRLVDEHEKKGGPPVKIHELLEGAEVVARRESPEVDCSELERIRMNSQERHYQQMVRDVVPLTKQKRQELGLHQQGLRFATNFATQVIVAFVGAFLLGYYFVETFVSPENFTAKVIAGAFCSFATLLLETCLLVVHEQKEEMIQRKRDRSREDRQKRSRVAKPARQDSGEPEREKPLLDKKED